MFSKDTYIQRREKLKRLVGQGIVLLLGNEESSMQMRAMQGAEAGMSEARVAAMVQEVATAENVRLAFPIILTVNGQTLHNQYGGALLQPEQMVLCDCGAESAMHYAGDLTRTFPVGNKFTQQQREVYEIVLQAYQAAAALLQPGTQFRDVHIRACEKLVEGLQQIGLMHGDAKDAVAQGAHALFFPCGLGHMLGMDTLDMEDLGEEYVGYTDQLQKSAQFGLKSLRLGRELETGFVLTVEPGLYFIPELIDRWAAEKNFPQFTRAIGLKLPLGQLKAMKKRPCIMSRSSLQPLL